MKFNKIVRGPNREKNDIETVHSILDAGFLCHVAFQHQGQTMMIPTTYGRDGDFLYLHGSTKNFMLNQIIEGQTACISVTYLDGIVLAKTLFNTSANYRSVVLFGKAEKVTNEEERMHGLKIITESIIPGRWDEVELGSPNEIKATMVVKFKIDRASAKVRAEGPSGDEDIENDTWSGTIPIVQKAEKPEQDMKFGKSLEMSKSARNYWHTHR